MRIAQVAPLIETVPPLKYGGIERTVSWLTEELVKQNHDVTLYAGGGSLTSARLVECSPHALRLLDGTTDPNASLLMMLEKVFSEAEAYDVIHLHLDYQGFPFARRSTVPTITTMHGRLDIPCLQPIYRHYKDVAINSISAAQREPLPELNWNANVYHGLPRDLHTARTKSSDYFAFVGRVNPEKGVEEAIAIAVQAGVPLKIGAKVDPSDKEYYELVFKPLLQKSPNVEFLGELAQYEKDELMGNAAGLLFPTMCRESFGLVMIEAMACGTPVLAFSNGSVPEIIEHGTTGFIVDSVEEAAGLVDRLPSLDRRVVRKHFEERFTAEVNAKNYLALYRNLRSSHRLLRSDNRVGMVNRTKQFGRVFVVATNFAPKRERVKA